MIRVTIKENSWLARMAASKLKSDSVAMVIGRTIYLHNSTKEEFLRNTHWVCHEIAHIKQCSKLGVFRFLVLYIIESLRKGYYKNKFEVEARQKERELSILADIEFK